MWGEDMAKIYYRKIINSDGAFTLEDVPEKWREEVRLLLEGDET